MELKEEIKKRLSNGFKKKEIITYLISRGYSESEIENEFPKLKQTNLLYRLILIISVLISLTSLTLVLLYSSIIAPIGIIVLIICVGTYLIFKLNKVGFIIHIIFYALLIISWFLGYFFYKEGTLLSPIFTFEYAILIMIIFSFMIISLFNLYKKV